MKVDADPLNMEEKNYAEPFFINMVEIIGKGDPTLKETEATEGLCNKQSVNQATEGLMNQKFKDNITENVVSNAAMLETTEGLMVKFEKIRITDGSNVEVNMVDINHPSPGTEEVERRL